MSNLPDYEKECANPRTLLGDQRARAGLGSDLVAC